MSQHDSRRKLMKLSKLSRLPILTSIGLAFISGIFLLLQASLLANIIDHAFIQRQTLTALLPSIYLLMILMIIRAFIVGMRERINFAASAKVRHQLRQQVLQHIFNLGPKRLQQWNIGGLTTTVFEQIEALHGFFADYLPQLSICATVPFLLLAFIFPVSWLAGILLLLALPLIPLFMALVGMGAEALSQRQLQVLARMGGHFLDVLRGLPTLVLFNKAKTQTKNIEKIADDYRIHTMRVLRIAFLSSAVLEFFASVAVAMVAVLLGLMLLHKIPFGFSHTALSLSSALFILILAPDVYMPLRQLGTFYHARAEAVAAMSEINQLLDIPSDAPEVIDDSKREFFDANLSLHQLSFNYEKSEPLFANINLNIKAGERIVIIGPSGSGKSTLLNLIAGFLRPTEGDISFREYSLTRSTRDQWQTNLVYLDQHTHLFAGSIADNLRLAKPNATILELENSCERLGLKKWIDSLQEGLDTVIGEQHLGLSGGQARRIAIARALLKNAFLLLLDEPTKNLDSDSEQHVLNALNALERDKTLIMISHRMLPQLMADRVFKLENGTLIEMPQTISGAAQVVLEHA